jgi:DNA-binding MarR family transcriptional regulator
VIQDRRTFRLFPSDRSVDLKEKLVNERKAANEEMLAELTLEERVLLRRFLLAIAD